MKRILLLSLALLYISCSESQPANKGIEGEWIETYSWRDPFGIGFPPISSPDDLISTILNFKGSTFSVQSYAHATNPELLNLISDTTCFIFLDTVLAGSFSVSSDRIIFSLSDISIVDTITFELEDNLLYLESTNSSPTTVLDSLNLIGGDLTATSFLWGATCGKISGTFERSE